MVSLKNERGFGIVSFLTLLPFLISILAVISGAAFLFRADAHLKHECRVSILKSQQEAAHKLNQLIALNPRARGLRFARKAAEVAFQAALATGLPPAIEAAEATLTAVKSLQTALRLQQRLLLTQGLLASNLAPLKGLRAVTEAAREESFANSKEASFLKLGWPKRGQFKLVAEPEGDPTPDYRPADQFSKLQTVDVDVKVSVASLLPEWLRNWLPTGGLDIDAHCQATLIQNKETQTWTETLNAVR